jgi:hypothetical protein
MTAAMKPRKTTMSMVEKLMGQALDLLGKKLFQGW